MVKSKSSSSSTSKSSCSVAEVIVVEVVIMQVVVGVVVIVVAIVALYKQLLFGRQYSKLICVAIVYRQKCNDTNKPAPPISHQLGIIAPPPHMLCTTRRVYPILDHSPILSHIHSHIHMPPQAAITSLQASKSYIIIARNQPASTAELQWPRQ